MHVSAKAKLCERGANPRQGVRRTGEGSKVKIAQLVRDDMYCHAELVSASKNETFFSRFTSHVSRKRIAFTLAEVLITLGIIGVVAALTLPTVINKFQMKAFEVAFKKEYSVLNNAIDFLQLDEDINKCYLKYGICPTEEDPNNVCYVAETDDCSALKQGLANKLKLTPISKSGISYPKAEDVFNDGGLSINRTVMYDYLQSASSAYILPDGAIVMYITTTSVQSSYYVYFIIDVNGKKGPNKWGYDVFFLTLTQKNGKLRLTDEYASLSQKGGRLPRTILLNKDNNDESNSRLW